MFQFNVPARELRKHGVRIRLRGQPYSLLAMLLEQPGDVVTRGEMREKLWASDTFVDFEHSLNSAIKKLRTALGDTPENSRYIETLPRIGYRFIAPVSELEVPRPEIAQVAAKSKPTTAKIWRIAVAGAIGILVILGSGFLYFHRTQALTEKDTIVLADFTNTTGDSVFDDALKQALRVQLEQSPFLNVLSDQEVEQELAFMGRHVEQPLTADIARDLCQRVGSKAVLTGSVASLGSHYAIGLGAFNCQTGKGLGSEQVEADDREHVLKALGNAATKIRKMLGESLASVQKYDAPIEQATTPSLEALKVYSLGRKASAASEWAAAVPFLQRAISLDANFAMAFARLGTCYKNLGENTLGTQNIQKAYELRERVSEPEKLYIESHYYQFVTGNVENARAVYQLWAQTYPRDFRPMPPLFVIYSSLGRYGEALGAAREASAYTLRAP